MTPVDRILVEALKKSSFVDITFEYGHDKVTIPFKGDKLLAHDVAIAVQGHINRKMKNEKTRSI